MTHDVAEPVRRAALPLRGEGDLDPLLERIGDSRFVLLGEASHGTSEYYTWRAALTRRLIEEKGFSFVAVEGDWPDCHRVNCSVTASPGAPEDPADVLRGFGRWPTWMWANEEVVEFTRWLRGHNLALPEDERVGFYGLDVYSLWDSLREALAYLREHSPDEVESALEAFHCLEPYAEDPQTYAEATWLVPATCEEPVVELLSRVRRVSVGTGRERDARFDAEQNARVAAGAEAYYRAMVRGGPDAWNLRDRHMADTLDRLVGHHEETARAPVRAVVWEHNTHIGDARFTNMAKGGMVNVGQLARERHGEDDVVLVGFGSHRGKVLAARAWDAPGRAVPLPSARPGSVEALLHDSDVGPAALFVFPPAQEQPEWLTEVRAHRAVGVVYRPAQDRMRNYVPTVLGRRYDAFCWFDRTGALTPLHEERADGAEDETWPFGE
ncbi:erythromycin esterase-like protein [Kineococcus xinjiangensis]|uniref:Erythromycin esterase-like protein n=1 Tax=Kineococcus xinjiangensis TaxID=512762 RepID=A0A2S6IC29_9ACTN|nr:erythromycin esterase family protein [Kineococcus xinjiangensis]PPK90809.1 erythromycin esterase-like protein [Kineococcus xinjiangensis]